MIQRRKIRKTLVLFAGISLLTVTPGLTVHTSHVNADTVDTIPRSLETRTINLNITQEDGSYATAGISDPGQPARSLLEAKVSRTNNWGEEKDADGNVTRQGSYVYYGSYQQSSDGNGSYNTEPIKWRVLDADTQDFNASHDMPHTMFLMSDKVLDQVNFNENASDGGIYSTCNLRKWLNSESFVGPYPENGFLNIAFGSPEQDGIAVSSKSANDEVEFKTLVKDNSGLSQNGMTDKIFVLSAEEANSDAFGFYYLNGYGNSNTRLLSATDYAKDKGICSTKSESKDWWLRSRITDSNFSAALTDCTGWLWAGNVYGKLANGNVFLVGVAPAFNLDLSKVRFTSVCGVDKSSSFALTSASDSAEWNLTMDGGRGFRAARNSRESGAVKPGGELIVDISSTGTPASGVSYTQISAMLVDKSNTVAAYGKIADPDATQTVLTIPAATPDGEYILKIFAEDINSASDRNRTDFSSNMVNIPVTVGDASMVSITNPADSHITWSEKTDNGTEKQGVIKNGGTYTPVIYTADNGYFFPENYNTPEINGIRVTRDSLRQITVSGIPADDASLTLAAATEKSSQPAPGGLRDEEKKIAGTDTTMEYRAKPADGGDTEWMDCTADFTEVTPGTWQIRYKETETKKAGAVTEVTVHEPQKPTPAPTPGIPDPKPTPTPDPSPQPSPDPTPQPPSVTQDPETSKIAGYDIFAVPCGKKLSARSLILTVKGKKSSTALAKIAAKKMTGKKSYKIRIKAYKMNNGKKVYISSSPTYHVAGTKNKTYTNAKKISVSPKKLVLRKGTSRRIKAKIIKQSKKKKLLPKSHGTSLRYRSTNKKIASVYKKGKIKARKKGICYICITALNGVMTQIKVKVK